MVISETRPSRHLVEADLRGFFERFKASVPLAGRRVLVVIPDHTRSGPTGVWFRVIADGLQGVARQLDFLIALGTHPPMSEDRIDRLVGIDARRRAGCYPGVRVFNHAWRSPDALVQVGVLSRARVSELSRGMLDLEVPVRVNRLVLEYDHVIICGPVFPHEVVGFSGGHKYFFPGISAPEVIDFTHWLGALLTNPAVNGTRDNPVREAIEAAADFVPTERSLIAYVVEHDAVAGVFGGPVRQAWAEAVELSARLHIRTIDRPFHTILSCAPAMYDDIWTAGKCMYKLEPVVADGGTLIIYAPHIDEVSYAHGKVLDEIGYHTRDYFLRQWDRFRDRPWGVLAHSTHVRGIGTYENGVERPRVRVVLATGIPQERCRRINLEYADPAGIDPADYAGREDEGVLMVPRAGEILYRLADMSRFM